MDNNDEIVQHLQRRLADAQAIADVRHRSLLELERRAVDLRDQAATFTTITSDRLDVFFQGISRLADGLVRAAHGYAEAAADDITYPGIIEELVKHGWGALTDLELDRKLADLTPPFDGPSRRGHRRGWRRGDHLLVLWFTGPDSLTGGHSSEVGALFDFREIDAVVTSRAGTRVRRDRIEAASGWSLPIPFYASYDRVEELLASRGWTREERSIPCNRRGIERSNGRYAATAWTHPRQPDLKVFAWHVGQELRVAYWAGAIVDFAHLTGIADREADREWSPSDEWYRTAEYSDVAAYESGLLDYDPGPDHNTRTCGVPVHLCPACSREV